MGAVAIAFLIAVGLSIYAFNKKKLADLNATRAENEARIAKSRALAAQSLNTLDKNPELALHLAYQGAEVTYSVDHTATPESESALHLIVGSYQTVGIGTWGDSESIKPQAAALSPDGRTVTTRNLHGRITIWDVASAKIAGYLAGHHGTVSALAFSPDGLYLASAGSDKEIKLWDWKTGKEIRHYFAHTANPTDLVFSQDGKELLSWEALRAIVWDVQSGRVLGEQDHPWGMPARFYPDGSRIAFLTEGSGEPMIWDFSSGNIVNTTLESGLTQSGTEIPTPTVKRELDAWKRLTDGLKLDTHRNEFLWGASGDLKFFARAHIYTGKAPGSQSFDIITHTHPVLTLSSKNNPGRVSFTAHGKYVYWIDGSELKLYEISTQREIPVTKDLANVRGAWSNDDGEIVTVTASGAVDIWRTQYRQLERLSHLDYTQAPQPGDLVGFDAEDRLAILPHDVQDSSNLRRLILYSVNSGKTSVQGIPKSVAFASEVGCCSHGKFFLGNPENGRLYPLDTVMPSKISGGLATNSDASMSLRMVGDEVQILDTASDREIARYSFPAGFGIAKGGAFLDNKGKEILVSSNESPTPAFVSKVGVNHWIVPPYSNSLPNVVWDGGCWISVFHSNKASFSSDGRKVAVAGGVTLDAPEQVSIWDTQRCQELAVLPRFGSAIAKLAFSNADSRLIIATQDGLVTFWDLGSNSSLFSLGLSLSNENTIIANFDISRDGKYIAVKTNDAIEIHLLQVSDLLSFAMKQVTRPLTNRECRDYLHVATCPQ
jgi:WD40 repeat protein